ncbi:hypothetical protein TanjilG_21029 [Lupinus angustifolius]|uniref:Transcription repressor n=1 Tax=Lupinus angustifolius TaxID=3871 RepID=A0A394DBG0_LUPAN|nr:PREDICTED: transcription repressor OFP8-like [Lupinus angustifolius]OIW20696.1 hypothetical protein TanjilG_21029 [Lupinus angustifolius]
MENQNHIKLRISRMFRSSFGSCRTRNFTDVMEKAVFTPPQNHRATLHQLLRDHPSPKPRPFPSICKSQTINDECIMSFKNSHPRSKISQCLSPFAHNNDNLSEGSCPLPSPNTFFNDTVFGFEEKAKNSERNIRNKKKKKKKVHTQKRREIFPFNSCAKSTNFGDYYCFSSEEDDETDTLFSSKSLSSDSSRSRRRHRKQISCHGKNDQSSEMGILPLPGIGKVKDTFAVVKRSSDPYNDFRTSMVEMIIEKQIFSPRDLQNLLQCFLSLNSWHHHKTIVEVFTEIWKALFSEWL